MDQPSASAPPAFVGRAQAILLTPRAEWDKIKTESADRSKLYVGYLLPLAVIAALAGAIGMSVFGVGAFGFSVRVGFVQALVSACVQVVMTLVSIYVLALIIDWLAPNFGTVRNPDQAHKLAVYSATANVLAGVFMIYPPLGALGILGLYSFVLLYLGMPRLMGTPDDKRVPYMAAIIVVAIVLAIVIGVITSAVAGAGGRAGMLGGLGGRAATSSSAEIRLPGGGRLNVDEMEKAANEFSRSMEAAANSAGAAAATGATSSSGSGGVPAFESVDPASVAAFLPTSLPGGFQRESLSSGSAVGASQAEGRYVRGDAVIRLQVMNMGAMGAFAAMAGAAGVSENREDSNGYSRTRTIDGRVFTEELDRSAKSATYSVLGRGVMVSADGDNVGVDDVRKAVEAIDLGRFEKSAAR